MVGIRLLSNFELIAILLIKCKVLLNGKSPSVSYAVSGLLRMVFVFALLL